MEKLGNTEDPEVVAQEDRLEIGKAIRSCQGQGKGALRYQGPEGWVCGWLWT